MQLLEKELSKKVKLKLKDNVKTEHICKAGEIYMQICTNIKEI